ncbi:hypothetical protein [Marixanthomonas spongiae]|uniref:Outer membrane protein beta-barrel domain-containing protein n=1 Tax=Marixanthomonas spongiae TaxID=2174845 RepID=A0A2U0I7N6_9FLAO|nr:hypothetical protein [Marixanthomonas spongiae]PVW17060.1 hypothetical protein DDV96_00595 [Marixanthomonas spongiae]
MKQILLILLAIAPILVFGQEKHTVDKEREYRYNVYAFGGFFFKDTKGFNVSVNGQIGIQNTLSIGLDVTRGFYQSPALNFTPSKEIIAHYPDDAEGAVPPVLVKGSDDDVFTGVSVYVAKEVDFGSFFALDIQAGPSLSFIKVRDYTYGYSPASGGFGGPNFGNGARISTTSTENRKTTFNGYARVIFKFKFGKLFSIGISPFANINSEESNTGIQAGLGFTF